MSKTIGEGLRDLERLCQRARDVLGGRSPMHHKGETMHTADVWRGHAIAEVNGTWVYEDTGAPVSEDPDRACGHCGLPNTPEGHDACLGTLPGVANACCGHGHPRLAYVQKFFGGDADQ